MIGGVCLALVAFALQNRLFAAFEGHAINVTATICRHSDIRSANYWQGHPALYADLLPVNIGNEVVDSRARVEKIFGDYDKSPIDNLKSELLAIKFNVAYFGIGGYEISDGSKTVDGMIANTENILKDTATGIQETDRLVISLRSLNASRKIEYCAQSNPPVPPDNILLINKIYYAAGPNGPSNADRWIELYNPGTVDTNIKGWTLCARDNCGKITKDGIVAPGSYALISHSKETCDKWYAPGNILVVGQNQMAGPLLIFDPVNEMLTLLNPDAMIIDQVNWGFTDSTWPNYNSLLWNPGLTAVGIGRSIGRNPDGFDTDQASDWIDFATPIIGAIDTGKDLWPFGKTHTIAWRAADDEITDTTSTLPAAEPVPAPTTEPAQIENQDLTQNASSTAGSETSAPEKQATSSDQIIFDQPGQDQSPASENENPSADGIGEAPTVVNTAVSPATADNPMDENTAIENPPTENSPAQTITGIPAPDTTPAPIIETRLVPASDAAS